MNYSIRLAKPRFKFSAAHFTIFSASEFENLHGHNYTVEATLNFSKLSEAGLAAPFHTLKEALQKVCEKFDEKILLAQANPFQEIRQENDGYWVFLGQKKYFFPKEDTVVLPLKNISSEELAAHLYLQLKHDWQNLPHLNSIKIKVEETLGQSVEVSEEGS